MGRTKLTGAGAADNRDSKAREAIQQGLWALDMWADKWRESGLEVTGLAMRAPKSEGDDWLCTIRAFTEEGKVVAFEAAETAEECLRRSLAKLLNGDLKWRVDKYEQR